MNRKTALAAVTFALITAAPELVPRFRDYRLFDWRTAVNFLDFRPRPTPSQPVEDEQLRLRPGGDSRSYGVWPVQDPAGDMDRFYSALFRTENEQPAVTRILHYGDSPTTADMITADVRTLLQRQFGDAGHGFSLIAKPWAWYAHRGVEQRGSGWTIDAANQTKVRDGLFGLGAVSFAGCAGASAEVRVRDNGNSHVEVSYLRQKGGGTFKVLAGEDELGEVNTDGGVVEAAFERFAAPPGTRRFWLKVDRGCVRVFGVSLEKSAQGVVYHSLGVNGAYVSILARLVNQQHWAQQLRHYRPNLVVINYGTNESVYPLFLDSAFEKELKTIISRIRVAVPGTSILLMSPMDRGVREQTGEIGTVPTLLRLIGIEERVAAQMGVAFFNTFQAMGGPGTMGRWYEAEPRLANADFLHPTPAGATYVGNLLYRALFDGYNRYKLKKFQKRAHSKAKSAKIVR